MLGEWAQRKKDRDVYFGIITALTEQRRVRPLTSLHQALILSLSTPGSNFTSKPCIPSSPLSFSPGFPFFSVSLFHHHFLFLSVALSFTSLAHSFFFFYPFLSGWLSPSPPYPPPSQIIAFFVYVAVVMVSWWEVEVNKRGIITETQRQRV